MAAFIPSRKDPEANEISLTKVREDKIREAKDGFDGTWVAHPDLVPVAKQVFDGLLKSKPNQVHLLREDVRVSAKDLLDVRIPGGTITQAGIAGNVNVGLQYLESWLRGVGAAAISNLMEDAATAEIARSQVWQWVRHGVRLNEGPIVNRAFVQQAIDQELGKVRHSIGGEAFDRGKFRDARELFERVALSDDFVEFLTMPAYERID